MPVFYDIMLDAEREVTQEGVDKMMKFITAVRIASIRDACPEIVRRWNAYKAP